MKDLFGRRSLATIVRDVMDKLGHDAVIGDVLSGVRKVATKDEWEQHADAAMAHSVRSALRQPSAEDNPLPEYLSVGGRYKALRLFDVSDYERKAREYAKAGKANMGRVYALRDACESAHGSSFDADVICVEFGLKVAA